MPGSSYPGLKAIDISEHLDSEEEELRYFYSWSFQGIWDISTLGLNEKNR
jgi:hypothetical protein